MSIAYGEHSGFVGPKGDGLHTPGGKGNFMRGAKGTPSSPTIDFARKHWSTVGISHELHLNSPIPVAIRERLMTYVIGSGLHPEPHISSTLTGLSEEECRKYEEIIATHYHIWEKSRKSTWEQNLTGIQQERLAFLTWITSGDFFFQLPQQDRPNWLYRTSVKLIAPELVRTPSDTLNSVVSVQNKDILNGIQRNKEGRDQYYWIANYYEEDVTSYGNDLITHENTRKHVAYKVYDDKTDRRFIYHAFSPVRINQRRGIPFIAPVVNMIQAATMLTESEISSAVLRTYFNVIISDDDDMIDTMHDMYDEHDVVAGGGADIDTDGTPIQYDKTEGDQHELELKQGGVHYIPGKKKVTTTSPNVESETYNKFFETIVVQIAAALGIAYEVLMEHFGQSYSASRAAILMSFKKFIQMRDEWVNIYKKPVYESFIQDLSLMGVIPVTVEELITDPWKQHMWSNVEWRGPSMGHVQPHQEAQAAQLRIETGLTTREMEAKELSPHINYRDLRETHQDEELQEAAHRSMLNQKYPLNTKEKISTTRSFFDTDDGGIANMQNPKEDLKSARRVETSKRIAEEENNSGENEGNTDEE